MSNVLVARQKEWHWPNKKKSKNLNKLREMLFLGWCEVVSAGPAWPEPGIWNLQRGRGGYFSRIIMKRLEKMSCLQCLNSSGLSNSVLFQLFYSVTIKICRRERNRKKAVDLPEKKISLSRRHYTWLLLCLFNKPLDLLRWYLHEIKGRTYRNARDENKRIGNSVGIMLLRRTRHWN